MYLLCKAVNMIFNFSKIFIVFAKFIFIFPVVCNSINVSQVPVITLRDGNKMPAFGLGTWLGLSNGIPVVEGANEVARAVKYALSAGYRHIDTASIYFIEDLVGKAVRSKLKSDKIKREDVFITTKLWNEAHGKNRVIPALKSSLKLLGMDYVDLYLMHFPVSTMFFIIPTKVDYVETWRAMVRAKEKGLTKSIGVSNFNLQQLKRLIRKTGVVPAVIQIELHLNLQQPELLEYCKKQNITVVAYTPFGNLLSWKAAKDAPPPRIDTPELVHIAEKYNKTTTQVALRFLLQLGAATIPKSVTKSRIESNIEVFDFELNENEMRFLKTYDKGYRIHRYEMFKNSPFYPFR